MQVIENLMSKDQIKELKKVAGNVTFREATGFRRRSGENGVNNLSKYSQAKYWDWSRDDRKQMREIVGEQLAGNFNEAWFLQIPQHGHFDAFTGKTGTYKLLLIPLDNKGTVRIDGRDVENVAGNAYLFNLNEKHLIPKSKAKVTHLALMFVSTLQNIGINHG